MKRHNTVLCVAGALTLAVPAIPMQTTPIVAAYHDVTHEWPDQIIATDYMLQEFCYPELDAYRGDDYQIILGAYEFTLHTLRISTTPSDLDPSLRAMVSGQGDSESYCELFSLILLHYGLEFSRLDCETDGYSHSFMAVKLNDKWYICDPYLEDMMPNYDCDYHYFLKGEKTLRDPYGRIMNWDNRLLEESDYMEGNSANSLGVPIYRLYLPKTGEHLYTASFDEMITLSYKTGWILEGIGWNAPAESSIPVYRLYNPQAQDHHYTTNNLEKMTLVRLGWKDEGVAWYSDEKQAVPLYRQYNPNVKCGKHIYTISTRERDDLVQRGWNDEGIAGYGTVR